MMNLGSWRFRNQHSFVKKMLTCFLRYGYIDPDGQVREFTYESGIPCDPLTKQSLIPQSLSSKQTQFADPSIKTGYHDYNENKFVLPNGKRVTVVVNENAKARGRTF